MAKYNTTQLNPDTTFERHVYHRDQFAHYLRWTHVLKRAKIGMKVLDFGCGSGNLAEVLYRNRFKAEQYLGLDIREKTIIGNSEKFKAVDWVEFLQQDLCQPLNCAATGPDWDLIACFEVLEHVQLDDKRRLLSNIHACMKDKTILLLSTPCYDPCVGPADNHVIDGEIGELTFEACKQLLEEQFTIKNVWGTFASQRDYLPVMSPQMKDFFDMAHEYFDANILSNLFAPFYPEQSRNCMWECVKK